MALDFVKNRAAIEEELDLVLVEVHLRNIPPGTLANSELRHHILTELQVPLITMCAYNDEEAISELVALGACSHVMKPLHTGSLNMLKKIALEHKSKKAIESEQKSKKETPQGPIPRRTKNRRVSLSTKRPQEMLIPERNNLFSPGSNEFEVPKVRKANGRSKKPGRIRWTLELHEMFLDAVETLGDKNATPAEIRKLMDVKGLTSKQIGSHLQKYRLLKQKAKQGGQHKKNASMKPVSELIGSSHSAATTESITPTVDADSTALYPLRLWTQVKEAAALKSYIYTSTSRIYRDDRKSVWDEYQKSLQKDFSASNRHCQQIGGSSSKDQLPAKHNVAVLDGGVSSESPTAAGDIGYGASIEGSSSLSTSLVDQVGENSSTVAAANNGNVENVNLLEGTMNKEHSATTDPSDIWAFLQSDNLDIIGPSEAREEETMYWMNDLERSTDQQNLVLEDPLQVDNAWNDGLALPSLINIDGSMVQEATVQNAPQEATVQNAPVFNPVMPIAQDDGFSQDQQNLGLEDLLQVDNAWNNTGLESPSLINIDGWMVQEVTVHNAPQEATIQNAPVYNPVMPIPQDDGFPQEQQNLGLEDLLQVDNAWNSTGLEPPSLINIDGSIAQEATVQNAPVHNPAMLSAQDDTFWSWSPPVGDFDFDMLF